MEATCESTMTLPETLVVECYQCGKCTAGCPMAEHMDLMPNRIFRLVQLGQLERAARCAAIWQCVSCFTCTTRCPQSVDCVGVLDALRQMAVERGLIPADQRRIVLFQEAFLNNVRKYGRLNEVQLIQAFKLAGFRHDRSIQQLLAGALLGPKLLRRGKLHLRGDRVRDRAVVNRIFERCASAASQIAAEERRQA